MDQLSKAVMVREFLSRMYIGVLLNKRKHRKLRNTEINSKTISDLRRTIQTAEHINGPQERWKTLNEIDAGDLDGLSYEEIKEQYPEEYSCRSGDKFMYR